MTLPATIQYGVVTWAALSAVADGADVDGNPDAVPVTGTLTFTPSATVLLDPTDKVTIIATPVTYNLDAAGVLRDSEGREGVTLVATDSPGVTPTGWTWTVAYKLNNGLSRGSFSFALPSGSTVDLTTVAPVGSSGGTQIIQGPQGDPGPAGPAGVGVPVGGATGQVLAKASAADYDTDWVDQTGGTGTVADATTTTKGVVQLAGDLSGTAAAPTVPGLASKANTADLATVATTGSYTDLTNQPTIPPAYTDEQAQDAVAAAFAAGTQTGVTVAYDDAAGSLSLTATGTTSPDATTTSKGIVQLAGDLAGTSAAPTVVGGTNHGHTASQISDSTAVGRSVLTAADATAARTAIGAGTSSLQPSEVRWRTMPLAAQELADDFTIKPDGAPGTAITGQAWTITGAPTMTVVGGYLTDTGTTGSAGYALLPAAGNLTYMGCEFSFNGGTTSTSSLGLIAFSDNLATPSTSDSPCHLVITRTGWTVSTITDAVTTAVGSGSFSFTLPNDGTLYSVEAVIDKAASTVFVRLPDGSVAQVSDPVIGTNAGSWLCVENFYTAPTTDAKPRTSKAWASSYPIGRQPHAAALRATVGNNTTAASNTTAISSKVTGSGITTITKLTQAAYDALGTKDAATLYVIQG